MLSIDPKGAKPIGPVKDITSEERHKATRHVAGMCADAEECAEILDVLGLDPAEGKRT